MASNSDYSADGAPPMSMPRQRSTVHDLYGLVGVSTPNATEADIGKAYEAMAKKLLPQLPNKAAQAAFSVLTNPAMRAQYDRDRLGYLYAHFKSYEQFPITANVEKNKSREDQVEAYAAVLQNHISDPMEVKKVKIQARLSQIRIELDEYKEKSKNVQEEWATSSNQILRMSANALREVEICARADIEMLENELGDLRGELPPKNIDGPPGRIASGQYGSEVSAHSKTKIPLAVNQRAPSIPRSPTVATQSRSASKLGVQVENCSTSYDSSSAARSDSIMAANDRVQSYLMGHSTSPTFYAPSTFLDPVNSQRDVERIIARAKRQSLDPETLSDLAMVKSDKLPKLAAEKMAYAGFDTAAFPEYDPAIKQKKTSRKQYSGALKKDKDSTRLANIGEMPELPEMRSECSGFGTIMVDVQLRKCSDASSSTIFPHQSPPGLGLVEYQERFGYHVIPGGAKEKMEKEESERGSNKVRPSKKKFPKPWISINDSVSMPAHPSSFRADAARVGVQPMNMEAIESPINRPDRPFQRSSRAASSTDPAPLRKGKAKKALASVSDECVKQNGNVTNVVVQPIPQKPSQTRSRTAIIESVQAAVREKAQEAKATREAEESKAAARKKDAEVGNEIKVALDPHGAMKEKETTTGSVAAMQELLKRSVSRMTKEEAARTLLQLSREGDKTSESQQRDAQNTDGDVQNDSSQPAVLPAASAHEDSGEYGGVPYGGPQYGGPQQSHVSYGYSLYGHAQQQYNLAQQPGAMYHIGPHGGPVIPTIYHRGFQQGYQTGGHLHQPYIERPSPFGAIGSEVKALKEQKAREEKMVAVDEKSSREQRKTASDKAVEASRTGRTLAASRKDNDDPFVD